MVRCSFCVHFIDLPFHSNSSDAEIEEKKFPFRPVEHLTYSHRTMLGILADQIEMIRGINDLKNNQNFQLTTC